MKEFKIFIKKALLLIILLIAADLIFGYAIGFLFKKQKSGKYFITTYALNNLAQDIVIIGNSHAAEHFNTPLIVKQLKLSAFNLGVQGQSMLYYYPVLESVLKYHKPKLIILNLDCTELSYNSRDYQRMSIFLPYFHQNHFIDSSIYLIDKYGKFKAFSSFYRYNSTLGYMLFNSSNNSFNKSYKSLGFDPQIGNFCKNTSINNAEGDVSGKGKMEFDSLKIKYLISAINYVHNAKIPIVVTTTPLYDGVGENAYKEKLEVLLKENKVEYWDYSNSEIFKSKCELFLDKTHLNETGANIFTNMIIKRINDNHLCKDNVVKNAW